MKLMVYDVECFAFDWLVVFKDIETGNYTCVHNDNEELKECLDSETVYIGFNSKHYDSYIIKASGNAACPPLAEALTRANYESAATVYTTMARLLAV